MSMTKLAQTLSGVLAVAAASDGCSSGAEVSLVQFAGEALAKQHTGLPPAGYGEVIGEGDPCFEDEQCSTGFCFEASDTIPGRCEDKDQLLFKCLWLTDGITRAVHDFNCPVDAGHSEACPRVGDPVKKTSWLPIPHTVHGLERSALQEMADDGQLECKYFALKCTWTVNGVEDFVNGHPTVAPTGPPTSIATISTTSSSSSFQTSNPTAAPTHWMFNYDDCKTKEDIHPQESVSTGFINSKFCPFEGSRVTAGQAEYFQLGPKREWAIWQEKGLINCVTPHQGYGAWSMRNLVGKRILCGGTNYNCFTKEEAEQACKLWSKNPDVPGIDGTAELCFKHELGETVGRNCRYMWTQDAVGKEGCYESAGNWADTYVPSFVEGAQDMADAFNEAIDQGFDLYDVACRAPLGTVHCTRIEEIPMEINAAEPYPKDHAHQRGFDAACCTRHMSDPYLLYNKIQ